MKTKLASRFISSAISVQGHLSVPAAVLVSLINPLFEERLSVHLYQGPLGVASILPMGLLFAVYYWEMRQLWRPILAHFLFGPFGLLHHT